MKENQKTENKMGYVPIPKLIIKMALPLIFSMLVQALYNVVDSIFVSRLGENALTALSLAFPLQLIVIAVFVGLSVGVSSAISRKLGEQDEDGALQIAEHGVAIGAVIYVVVAIFGAFFAQYTIKGFTSDQTIIDYAISYIRIVLIFSFGSILNQAGRAIFRGTGETVKPMIAQLIGAGLNIVLDPIMIFGYFGFPALGVKGAAIATVTAQIIAMLYIWVQLLSGKSLIKIKVKKLIWDMKIVGQVLSVGFPSFIMQALGSVMLFFMNMILSNFGETSIAIMGVYFRVQSLVFMPVFALASSMMPVVGYNFGAHNKKRMYDAVKFSLGVTIGFLILALVAFQILPKQILSMFNATEALYGVGIPAFRTISLLFPIAAVNIIFSTAFQGLGKAYYSLMISLFRMIVILLPAAYLLSRLGNVDYVWYAFVIADVLASAVTIPVFRRTMKQSTLGWE